MAIFSLGNNGDLDKLINRPMLAQLLARFTNRMTLNQCATASLPPLINPQPHIYRMYVELPQALHSLRPSPLLSAVVRVPSGPKLTPEGDPLWDR